MKINNKSYKRKPLSFNVICQLEDLGLDITQMDTKSMSMLRGYLAICMNTTVDKAGEELEKHCINGGDVNELLDSFGKAVEESGFFQALSTPKKNASQKEEKE